MKINFILGILAAVIAGPQISFTQGLPIKPTRTISFTTDEGSYMNVDVSPDGKTLAFDLLGDIYTIPVKGGNATQLTRGVALHFRPIWSRNGKNIACISDISGSFHVNIINLSGRSHVTLGGFDDELNPTTDAIWTPDNKYIVINRSVYGLSGGKITLGNEVPYFIGFSNKKHQVYAFNSNRLSIYDLTNNSEHLLANVLGYPQNGLAVSPNAHWLAYICDSNAKKMLIVQNLEDNVSRILVPSLVVKDPRNVSWKFKPHFSFSPDNKYIYIGYGGKIHQIELESGNDDIVPFKAKVKADLGPLNYNTYSIKEDSAYITHLRSCHISPDQKHLVFSVLERIYTMDLPHGAPHVLIPQSLAQFQPVYSPDGLHVAYVTWCDTSGGELWVVSSTGEQPIQLTHLPGQYQCPAWSPDGKFIAVAKGASKLGVQDDPGTGQLILVPRDGGPTRIIDDSVPLFNHLSFSADGNRIMYMPKQKPNSESRSFPQLISRDLNGNDLQVIALGYDLTSNHDKMLSPDGRFMVYSVAEDLYLVPTCSLTYPLLISNETKHFPVIRFSEGIDPCWERGGAMLTWNYANKFYCINPDKIIDAAKKNTQKEVSPIEDENTSMNVSVLPDQTFPIKIAYPIQHSQGFIALMHAQIVTARKDEVFQDGTILIKNGRIVGVGPSKYINIPVGTKVYNLQGKTIIPGFIDLHLHIHLSSNILSQQSWKLLVDLAYGITTARDPSANYDQFGYQELLASGVMIGPRLFSVGRAVVFPNGIIRIVDQQDADAVVRKRAESGAIVVKDYLDGTPRLPRQWLLQACRSHYLNITNEGYFDPLLQLGMVKDGCTGVEHNPMWGDAYQDVISFYAASGIYFTPTLQVSSGSKLGEGEQYFKYKYWHQSNEKLKRFTISDTTMISQVGRPDSYEAILKTICNDSLNPLFLSPAILDARIRHAGGHIGVGSHGEDQGIGIHNELWALQMGGMTNMEALQAATIVGAEALGVQKDLGSIEVGKIADLIVLNKNPLDDIHNSREIRYVMKDGILYDGDTLDEIWPEQKKCPDWKLHVKPN